MLVVTQQLDEARLGLLAGKLLQTKDTCVQSRAAGLARRAGGAHKGAEPDGRDGARAASSRVPDHVRDCVAAAGSSQLPAAVAAKKGEGRM